MRACNNIVHPSLENAVAMQEAGQQPVEGQVAPANTHRAWLHLEPLFLHKTLGPAIEHSKEEGLSRQKPLSVGIRSLPTSPRQQARPQSPASGLASGPCSSSCMS